MTKTPRSYIAAFIDRIIAWFFGFPPERSSYTIQDLRIPISAELSRIELAAALFQPVVTNDTQFGGTILMSGPYGRSFPFNLLCRMFAARGYQILSVSCRGTFGSGGEFDAFRNDVKDGKEVVEWMRKQDWYTGRFATIGGSYLGFTQWALLQDNPPPDMVTAVIEVGPHDCSRPIWGHGALDLDIVRWGDMVAHQEEGGLLSALKRNTTASKRHRPVFNSIPLLDSLQSYFQGYAPWVLQLASRSDLSDAYYAPMQCNNALALANIPILLVTGWNDVFLNETMAQYTRLQERGCDVALTAGPWTHLGAGSSQKISQQRFSWIEDHLFGKTKAHRAYPVEYYVTGADEWRSASKWPPQTTTRDLFLYTNQQLSFEKTPSIATTSDFIYDPKDATPTVGGNLLFGKCKVNDSMLFSRSDVLSFTTEPLKDDIEVCGNIAIELSHSTSSPYADLFVRVSEVDGKGRSFNITETLQRLDPSRGTDPIHLKLNPCAHRFGKGKKIRLYVAGGNFPHYSKNIGTANNDNNGSQVRSVKHTITHGGEELSRVIMPVVAV
ncbi:CocE/NonD hydrolase [Amniculicola lignicola CBS 123094]|uniref:CocE/NonD hydrolase n=1 Tax=Amniculicola lignicola CBS 123094 TaxID=1392246 RepID=A0A6A5WHG7_9PLEO|nr:CocE/NonD hydrolase [Amniculicola lignicola CBS 123094]